MKKTLKRGEEEVRKREKERKKRNETKSVGFLNFYWLVVGPLER